jgi:hypothetical protein
LATNQPPVQMPAMPRSSAEPAKATNNNGARPPGAPSSSLSRADLELLAKVFLSQHPELKWSSGWIEKNRGMDPVVGKGTMVFFETAEAPALRSGDLVIVNESDGTSVVERFVQTEGTDVIVRPDHGGRTRTLPFGQIAGRVTVILFGNPTTQGNTEAFLSVLAQY